MKYEDLIRKFFPKYESKRELRQKYDRAFSLSKSLIDKVRAHEQRPRELNATYIVSRKFYKEMCETGRYSIMKHKVQTEIAQKMVDEIAPMIPIIMRPIEHAAIDGTAFEFRAKMLYYMPEPTGLDGFRIASEMASE